MKARGIVFHSKRESHSRHYDKVTLHMVHEGLGLVYEVISDNKGCHVKVVPDLPPQRNDPQDSPLERQHAQEAKARSLYSMHHWAQYLMEQYHLIMEYMKDGGSATNNPMMASSRDDIKDREQHAIAVATWVTLNPMINASVTGDRLSFADRMRVIGKLYDLDKAIEARRKGFKIGGERELLLKAYSSALGLNDRDLVQWLSGRDI